MTLPNRTIVPTKTVELLKQKAKKLKKETGIPHHQALEQVAIDIGLKSWHQVTQYNEPFKLSEEAYKYGAILAMDVKDSIDSMGLNDTNLVEDTSIISEIIRNDYYKNFINSTNEDDPKNRTIKDSMDKDEMDEWFEDYFNDFLFFRINSKGLSIEDVLKISKEHFFFMPEFIFLNGEYYDTYNLPSTNDDGDIVGIRL